MQASNRPKRKCKLKPTKVTLLSKKVISLTKGQPNAIAYEIKEYQQQIHAQIIAGIEVENR